MDRNEGQIELQSIKKCNHGWYTQ